MKKQRLKNALKQTLLIVGGGTIGIWGIFLVVLILSSIIPTLRYPNFIKGIENGNALIISFSIITSILIVSVNNKHTLNKYSLLAIFLLVLNFISFLRCVALNGEGISWIEGSYTFIFATILLFFTIKNSYIINWNTLWLRKSKSKYYYDIFLSFAIAGNKNEANRNNMKNKIDNLDKLLKDIGYQNIFNASVFFDYEHHKQEPTEAVIEDFTAVGNSKNFILFYPEKVPTSALMELGYALADDKKILLISKNIHTLPFLAKGMSEAHENVKTLFFDDYEEGFNGCLNAIKHNHEHYFKK